MKKIILVASSVFVLISCGEKKETESSTSVAPVVVTNPVTQKTNEMVNEPEGVLGVIDIPEILTLAFKDSAAQEEIGFKMGKAYSAIEGDMNELHLETDMPPGVLIYNNNPNNFVFECVVPINEMPKTQPKRSTVVVLEATKAIVYNYYGPYDKMYTAYDVIKKYMADNKLEQSTVAREFYLSDATLEKDPSKWLSKIYIPVK